MPSDFEYAFNSTAKTYLASIKFGSQQRVYVEVKMGTWTTSIDHTSNLYSSGSNANVKTNVGTNTTTSTRPIAYIGYAYVEEGKKYKVEISSLEKTYYLPKFKGGRPVKYVLVPIYGVMVDKNGTVLTKTEVTQEIKQILDQQGIGEFYQIGDTIPIGYAPNKADSIGTQIEITSTRG